MGKQKKKAQRVPDNASLLNQALQYQQSGQLEQAKVIYEAMLKKQPLHASCLHLLGYLYYQCGERERGIMNIRQAIRVNPNDPMFYNNLGIIYHETGRIDQAIDCFQKCLELKPDYAKAALNLGNVYRDTGRIAQAIEYYHRAVSIQPDYFEAYHNLGMTLQSQKKYSEAIECYTKAIQLNPNPAETYNCLGTAYLDTDHINDALACFGQAIRLNPNLSNVYINIGNAYQRSGDIMRAIQWYQQAIDANPSNVQAYCNLGAIYLHQGNIQEAICSCEQAIKLYPNFVEAHTNLGNAYYIMGELNQAVTCYEKAIQLNPKFGQAYNNLGNTQKQLGQINKAITSYQQALSINPHDVEALFNLGTAYQDIHESEQAISCFQQALHLNPNLGDAVAQLAHQLRMVCAWEELDSIDDQLDIVTQDSFELGITTPETPFMSLCRHMDSQRDYRIASSWSSAISNRFKSLSLNVDFAKRKVKPYPLTIGYLSNNFHNHPTSYLILGLLNLHNRSRFQINCYAYGNNDHSEQRERIQQACDGFTDLNALSYSEAAKRIYDDGVDILVDLVGYMKGNRIGICALRPAPIQVRYLGLAGTTGADFFDYLITDSRVTPPEDASNYSEKFVYMPYCYQVNTYSQFQSHQTYSRRELGLPEHSFVFSSFNQSYKIDENVFASWIRILHAVSGSVLWLFRKNRLAESNLKKYAAKHGIDPDRLIFADPMEKKNHIVRLGFADLVLDTWIINGAATTSDALWAGVPVITLTGRHFASRMSSSILSAIGLSECIAKTSDEYENIAISLAQSPAQLTNLKKQLFDHRTTYPLFNTRLFCDYLEIGYEHMWNHFIKDKPVSLIDLKKN
ncbi:MAG: tetratricopeptide repeat protein [Desulfobacterales bacterium]|nr:tetratricopeptide repeat protein [Desulfobacterales bacterium]